MRKLAIAIISVAVVCAVWAFAIMDANPANWSFISRSAMTCFAVGVSAFAVLTDVVFGDY